MNQNTLNHRLVDAAADGDLNKVKELVNKGAPITNYANRAIRWAAKNGNLDIVKYLVKMGADINDLNNWALSWAIINQRYSTIEFIKLCQREDKMSKNLVKIMLKNV